MTDQNNLEGLVNDEPPQKSKFQKLKGKVKEEFNYWWVDTSLAHTVYTPLFVVTETIATWGDMDKVWESRKNGLIVGTITTRLYTKYADWLIKKFNITKESSKKKKWLVETGGALSFSVPIYSAILAYSGVPLKEIAVGLPLGIAIGVVTSRPYRWGLNKWRKYCGLKPAIDE
ncbi:L-alanine exporter AlaE [Candidatus Woesearchaeota archaeon]|nr:L-alanine exporter AlaE [Candidatus Woesearchaeota archaeon]